MFPPPWLSRRFTTELDPALAPNFLVRLRGTPARLEELTAHLPPATRTTRADGWSIQENAGHLIDLDVLFAARVDDFENGAATLTPWDGKNEATERALHNMGTITDVLARFRATRTALVERLDRLPIETFAKTALHPRLEMPMRFVDLLLFHAEHDDHHLARIHALARRFA